MNGLATVTFPLNIAAATYSMLSSTKEGGRAYSICKTQDSTCIHQKPIDITEADLPR